jgi:hypothetical protein
MANVFVDHLTLYTLVLVVVSSHAGLGRERLEAQGQDV